MFVHAESILSLLDQIYGLYPIQVQKQLLFFRWMPAEQTHQSSFQSKVEYRCSLGSSNQIGQTYNHTLDLDRKETQ